MIVKTERCVNNEPYQYDCQYLHTDSKKILYFFLIVLKILFFDGMNTRYLMCQGIKDQYNLGPSIRW